MPGRAVYNRTQMPHEAVYDHPYFYLISIVGKNQGTDDVVVAKTVLVRSTRASKSKAAES
jgi:hypothetical protein